MSIGFKRLNKIYVILIRYPIKKKGEWNRKLNQIDMKLLKLKKKICFPDE